MNTHHLTRFTLAEPRPVSQPAFVAFPVALLPIACGGVALVTEIYREAYERAREINRPSRWAPLYAASEN